MAMFLNTYDILTFLSDHNKAIRPGAHFAALVRVCPALSGVEARW